MPPGWTEITTWRGHLLPLLASAVLLGLCFPPAGMWALVYAALVPAAVIAARSGSWVKLWVCGAVSFGLWWGLLGRWMVPVTLAGHLILSAYIGVITGGTLVAMRQMSRRLRWPMVVLLPLAWTSVEVCRATMPFGGMNWFTLAQALAPSAEGEAGRIVQAADLLGWPIVTMYVAMINGLLADFLTRPVYAKRVGRRRPLAAWARRGLFTASLTTVALWTYGLARLSESHRATRPGPTVAVVQTNTPQSNKNAPTRETHQAMWDQLAKGTMVARAEPNVDWVVWPETGVPAPIEGGYPALNAETADYWRLHGADRIASDPTTYHQYADELGVAADDLPGYLAGWFQLRADLPRLLAETARLHDAWLIVGAPGSPYADEPIDAPTYNSVYVVTPDGQRFAARYDKMHRVPFGEYLPLVDRFPQLKDWFIDAITPYAGDYTIGEGRDRTVFDLPYVNRSDDALAARDADEAAAAAGETGDEAVTETEPESWTARVVTPICFEDTVARHCRSLVYADGAKRADVLVNLTNDGWFAGSAQPWQHLQLASLRCIENRVPMARAVNTGVSGFIDSSGTVRALVRVDGEAAGVEGVAVQTMRLDERVTLFGKVGMTPMYAVSLGTATLALLSFVWPQRGRRRTTDDADDDPIVPTRPAAGAPASLPSQPAPDPEPNHDPPPPPDPSP